MAACWATWPVLPAFFDAIPTGDSPYATVPQLNCWIMWWNMSSLTHGLKYYWHAPYFYPAHSTLALSEPLSGSLLFAPLVRLYGSPIPAYNALVWFTLVLNGFFGFKLLQQLQCKPVVALAGGMALCLHPLAVQNMEAIQLAALWPTLWCISLLLRFSANPSPRIGFLVGISLTLQCYFCVHHLLFWLILLVVTLWLIFPYQAIGKGLASLGIGMLTFLCLAGPTIWKIKQVHSEYGFSRSPDTVLALSASFNDWLTSQNVPWSELLNWGEASFPLLPGLFRVALAASIFWWLRKRSSIADKFLLAVAGLSIVFSFGSRWEIGQINLWEFACQWLSPLSSVRSPYRFAYFSQMTIIVLAALALNQAWQAFDSATEKSPQNVPRAKNGLSRWGMRGVLCIGLFLVAFEIRPPQSFLAFPPSPRRPEAWIHHIQREVQWTSPLLCLPIAEFNTEQSQQRETNWMMYATQHTRPIVNGYSGFTPSFWRELRTRLRGNLDRSTLDSLRSEEIKVIVLRTDLPQSKRYSAWLESLSDDVELDFQDDRYQIYRVKERTSPAGE